MCHRLLPKRTNSVHYERHINTVPVKLKRSSNDSQGFHVDTEFCRETIRYLEELAWIIGPEQVLFISNDDKLKIYKLGGCNTDQRSNERLLYHADTSSHRHYYG